MCNTQPIGNYYIYAVGIQILFACVWRIIVFCSTETFVVILQAFKVQKSRTIPTTLI